MNKKDFINKFKKLKEIKADESLKFNLYGKIEKEIGADFVIKTKTERLLNQKVGLNVEQAPIFQKISLINKLLTTKNMFIPILLIIALMGGGAGATYASQSSLPGEILYPVKIASEKVQTALTIDNAKEADLHLKFSSKRLEEIEKLAEQKKVDEQIIKSTIANYQNELSESGGILTSEKDKEQAAEIAKKIADSIFKNKLALAKISKEIEDKNSLNDLKDALENANEHGDAATLILLQSTSTVATEGTATSTENTATSTDKEIYGYQVRVLNKIAEAKHKISEVENFLAKKENKGIDITEAKKQIENANALIKEAENLLAQDKFVEAFLKAKEAQKTAETIKDAIENKDGEENESNEESRQAFMINYILNGESTSTNASSVEEMIKSLEDNNKKENEFKGEETEKIREINNENSRQKEIEKVNKEINERKSKEEESE